MITSALIRSYLWQLDNGCIARRHGQLTLFITPGWSQTDLNWIPQQFFADCIQVLL